jgi:hypothetical protein
METTDESDVSLDNTGGSVPHELRKKYGENHMQNYKITEHKNV